VSSLIQGNELRNLLLGRGVVSKAVPTYTAATFQLFTVTGGEVLITALWGKVSTTMAGANTINLQVDPTTGTTAVVITATDLGTTNTDAGTVIGVIEQGDGTIDFSPGAGHALSGLVVPIGEIESVGTEGTIDGGITWYCTWIPLTDGAVLTAAA
jgi:hypothetical protein